MDPDNARLMVKLAIGGKTVTVSQYAVQLVGRKDYDKNSKDLSKLRISPTFNTVGYLHFRLMPPTLILSSYCILDKCLSNFDKCP